MKRLFLLGFICLVTACSSTTTTTCKDSKQAVQTTHTYTSKEDTILTMNTINTLDISTMEAVQVEQIKTTMESKKAGYSDLDGVVYTVTYDANKIVETITIDCEKADLSKLNELHLISKSGSGKDNIVSLQQTLSNMKIASFTCK